MSWLFMGVQEDPDMDVFEGRGIPRMYDASRPPADAEVRKAKEPFLRAPPAGKPGGFYPGGEGPCVCGLCFYRLECGGAP